MQPEGPATADGGDPSFDVEVRTHRATGFRVSPARNMEYHVILS